MKDIVALFLQLLKEAIVAAGDTAAEDELLMSAQERIKATTDLRAFGRQVPDEKKG